MAFAAFATAEAQPQAPKRRSRVALLLLLPGILYLVLFFLTPLISLVLTSLQAPSEFGDIGVYDYAFNWQNYVTVVEQYWPHILRSFGYALAATVFALLFSYPIAYFIGAWVIGPLTGAFCALTAVLAILCTEIAIGIRLLGAQFERFDLSSELRP